MHFKPKGVLGIAVPVLLGGALAAGALALPAHAQTYQDTALSATAVTDETFGGRTPAATNGTHVILADPDGRDLDAPRHTADRRVPDREHDQLYGHDAPAAITLVADATDSAGNAEALVIPVTLGANTIQTAARSSRWLCPC